MLIKTRTQLEVIDRQALRALQNYNPKLLNKLYLPTKSAVQANMNFLENKYFKKNIKPIGKQNKHSAWLQNYKKNKPKWYKLMTKKYPHILYGKKDYSFKKMQSKIPKNVIFELGQTWKGITKKYWFICVRFGKFKACPHSMIQRSWPKGLLGHPKNKLKNAGKSQRKKIKCFNNFKVYSSASEASKKLNLVRQSIQAVCNGKRKHTKGYRFKYV